MLETWALQDVLNAPFFAQNERKEGQVIGAARMLSNVIFGVVSAVFATYLYAVALNNPNFHDVLANSVPGSIDLAVHPKFAGFAVFIGLMLRDFANGIDR